MFCFTSVSIPYLYQFKFAIERDVKLHNVINFFFQKCYFFPNDEVSGFSFNGPDVCWMVRGGAAL